MSDEVDAACQTLCSRVCLALPIGMLLVMNAYLLGALDVDVISEFTTLLQWAAVAIIVYPFLPVLFIGMNRLEVRLRQQLGQTDQEATDE